MLMCIVTAAAFVAVADSASIKGGSSCGDCRAPKFQDREFYLPFCAVSEDGARETHDNVCGAICSESYTQGSCEGCEKKCSPVFKPKCSKDQRRLFANRCHAKCALGDAAEEAGEFVDCEGLNIVIPGKTKLPPSWKTQVELQSGGSEQAEEDEDAAEEED